ncbi:MAG TPA: hypothetical protein VGM92_08090 [Candidatus Kapabacteria bacterium]|jgi:hypothetical protein
MKKLIQFTFLLLLFGAFFGCGSWQPIGFQNAAAMSNDGVLFRDVQTLVTTKTDNPPVGYNPVIYGQIYADIANCQAVYNTIPKSNLSLNQLTNLSNEIALFKAHDSTGASSLFFQINGPELVRTAHDLDTLESSKLTQ